MKKLKKQILALLCCICMLLVSLSGCALVVKDNSKTLAAKAIRVGSTVLTKQEVVNLWYSFYTENVNYFYYYDEDQIIDIFYKNVIVKYAVLAEADKLKTAGKIFFTNADNASVWMDVFESISSSVDTYETALLEQNGVEDDDLPTRLQSSSTASTNTSVKSYLFEDYHFDGMDDYTYSATYTEGGDKVNASEFGYGTTKTTYTSMISLLEKYILTKQAKTLDDDEELIDTDSKMADPATAIAELLSDSKYFEALEGGTYRQQAYDMYISNLLLSSKAEGKTSTKQAVLYDEVKRLYESYYETYVYNTYSTYIKSLISNPNAGDYEYGTYALSNSDILQRYLQLLGKDIQNYKVEQNYIAVVEAEADNTLLLYHYNGEYYYFSVQHLLVAFTDEITEAIGNIYGSDSSSDTRFDSAYKTIRDNYFKVLGLQNWTEYDNVIYRDENGYEVYKISIDENEGTKEYLVYFDSTKEIVTTDDNGDDIDEDDQLSGYYYTRKATAEEEADDDGNIRVYLTNAQFAKCKNATITVSEMLERFNTSYAAIIEALTEAKTAIEDASEISAKASEVKAALDKKVEDGDIYYSIYIDLIEDYLAADTNALASMKNKIYSNVFMQHAYVYSSDSASLGTDLSDYVGMIISSEDDNNTVAGSTYVSDFTNGARKLLTSIIEEFNSGVSKKEQTEISADNFVISDYGIHVLVVNDVYKGTSSITGESISYEAIYGSALSATELNQIAAISEVTYQKIADIVGSKLSEAQINELVNSNLTGTALSAKAEEISNSAIDAKIDAAIEILKNTYVCEASSQTIYEYVYEKIRDDLVGSSGTLFTAVRNAIYANYTSSADLFEFYDKIGYDLLLEYIGV